MHAATSPGVAVRSKKGIALSGMFVKLRRSKRIDHQSSNLASVPFGVVLNLPNERSVKNNRTPPWTTLTWIVFVHRAHGMLMPRSVE